MVPYNGLNGRLRYCSVGDWHFRGSANRLHYNIVIFFCFFLQLFCLLLLHPPNEENAHNDNIQDSPRNPHDETTQLLIRCSGYAPDARRRYVGRIQRGGECQACPKGNGGHAAEEEIEYLASQREAWESLLPRAEDGPPCQHAKEDES